MGQKIPCGRSRGCSGMTLALGSPSGNYAVATMLQWTTWAAPGGHRDISGLGGRLRQHLARDSLTVHMTGLLELAQVDWLGLPDWQVGWADVLLAHHLGRQRSTTGFGASVVRKRLSCRFCVLVGRKSLVTAARLDPAGALPPCRRGGRDGPQLCADVSMAQVIALAEAADADEGLLDVAGLSEVLRCGQTNGAMNKYPRDLHLWTSRMEEYR